jgi:hypothetical protein
MLMRVMQLMHVARMGEKTYIYKEIWLENLRKVTGAVMRVILKLIVGNGWEVVERIHLAESMDLCWVLMSMVMKLRISWNAENLLATCLVVGFPKRCLLHGVVK